jgi:hypothetical protein
LDVAPRKASNTQGPLQKIGRHNPFESDKEEEENVSIDEVTDAKKKAFNASLADNNVGAKGD